MSADDTTDMDITVMALLTMEAMVEDLKEDFLVTLADAGVISLTHLRIIRASIRRILVNIPSPSSHMVAHTIHRL
jgi:hypothetical protein